MKQREIIERIGEIIQPRKGLAGAWREETVARHWVEGKKPRFVRFPRDLGQARALVLAESGAGKSQLLRVLLKAAHAQGASTTFIDCKGDPEDGASVAEDLNGQVFRSYDVFRGDDRDRLTDRLFSLWPSTGGDGDHYRAQARSAVRDVQGEGVADGFDDLISRIRTPGPWVGPEGLEKLTRNNGKVKEAVVDGLEDRLGQTAQLFSHDGWSFDDEVTARVMPLQPARSAEKQLGQLIFDDLKNYLADRITSGRREPELIVVDEYAQLVGEEDPALAAATLFETARSAGIGLILVSQSAFGLSANADLRSRLLSSGATILAGRTNSPEAVSMLAGTNTRMESSADATGESGLGSGRAQHAFELPPNYLRQASMGSWFIVQSGSVTPFRAWPV